MYTHNFFPFRFLKYMRPCLDSVCVCVAIGMRYAVWQVKFRENVVSWIRYKLNLPPHSLQQHCTSPSHSRVPIHRLTHTNGIRDGPETNGALFIHFFSLLFLFLLICFFFSSLPLLFSRLGFLRFR